MSAAPLTLHDVAAWEARYLPPGHALSPATLDLVKRLDDVFLSESG